MKKKFILIAVGTHPQQFDRLLKECDRLALKFRNAEFFAQTGFSGFEPENFRHKKMMGLKEFDSLMEKADIVISHGGEGIIGQALQLGKKLIMVPRMAKFGEHTNDHQLELVEAVAKEKKIPAILEIRDLEKELSKALKAGKNSKAMEKTRIIKILEGFVEKNFK